MTKLKIIITALFSVAYAGLMACDCNPDDLKQIQELDYSHSPIIFVGDVLTADRETGTYRFTIVEIFKGNPRTLTIDGKQLSSCSGFPDKGRWIIYVESISNGVIDFSICGLSRSFDNPQLISAKEYAIPPPPKRSKTDSKYSIQADIDFQRAILKIREKALADLEIEIGELRKRK